MSNQAHQGAANQIGLSGQNDHDHQIDQVIAIGAGMVGVSIS